MALRNIFTEGDDILRKKSRKVEKINEKVIEILDDMIDTMREHYCIGIAAPQVGILKSMFVVELDDKLYELINPEILEMKGEVEEEEGCLSVPNKVGMVKRPEYVKIKGLNRYGEEVFYEAEGLLAKAFCHENDHLSGILYIDKAKNVHEVDR